MNTLYWKYAQIEQKNLWNIASTKIAWNTITPLYYQGVTAGSEFVTYVATKLYICLELHASYSLGNAQSASGALVVFYDEANAINGYGYNNMLAWDTTAAGWKYLRQVADIENIYFSRLTSGAYDYIRFNGYRLNQI